MTDKELSQRAKEYFAQIRKTDRLIQRLTDTVNTLRSGLTSQSYELKPEFEYTTQWLFEIHGKALLAFAKENADFLKEPSKV